MTQKTIKAASWLDTKKRRVSLIILFVIFNIVVILLTARSEFGNSQNAAKLSEVKLDWWLLIPATFCFISAVCLDIYKYFLMIKNMAAMDNRHINLREARKTARRTVILGKYYDNITPAAIGGQPFQIYYMRKYSQLSKGASTSIPVFGMISTQIGFLIIAIFCFIIGARVINNPVLLTIAWFGLLFFAFWPIAVAGINFFPKPTIGFIKLIIKLLAKIKLVKNREMAFKKVESEVKEYTKSISAILKARGLFIKCLLISILYYALILMIPFFVLGAFGGDTNFWLCFATTAAVISAVYFVPTPGNTGAAEGTFFLVFSGLSTGYVFWAMLVWRFFSYYAYILMGPIVYLSMHLEKKRKINVES